MNQPPSVFEALLLWFKIGCLSFGGPSGQIALLHTEIVEKRAWVSDEEFVRALQFCMLLPAPEAQQLATYLGWRLHGIKGRIVAGALFLLPAVVLLWGVEFPVCERAELAASHGLLCGTQARRRRHCSRGLLANW